MSRQTVARVVAAVVAVLILSATIVFVTERVTRNRVDPIAVSTAKSLRDLSDQRAVILRNLCDSGNTSRKKDLAIWEYLATSGSGPVFVHAYSLAQEKDQLVNCDTGKKIPSTKGGA